VTVTGNSAEPSDGSFTRKSVVALNNNNKNNNEDNNKYDNNIIIFYSCTVHLDTIESFIYPTDAQLDCSRNVKIYIKIYMRGAATCFGFSQPSSGS